MYDEILLPLDGSPGAETTIDHAIHVAKQNDAVVHVVHVLEPSQRGGADDTGGDAGEFGADIRELLQPGLEAAETAGVRTVEAVLRGPTHEELVEYIEDHDIDLVVMGTHAKSGIGRMLLGSTAEEVVRNSPSPVLTVRKADA